MTRIGQWAHRAGGSKSHLVESEVADRFVMRCGKQMDHQLGADPRGALVFDPPTWGYAACLACAGGRRKALLLNDQPTLNTRSDQ